MKKLAELIPLALVILTANAVFAVPADRFKGAVEPKIINVEDENVSSRE